MATAPGHLLADPIAAHLRRRIERAFAEGRKLLGDSSPAAQRRPVGEAVAEVAALRSAVVSALADAADPGPSEAWELLEALHDLQLDVLRRRFERRAATLERVHVAAAKLRELTSPAALVAAGAEQLSAGSEFERVIVSGISDARLVAEAVSFGRDEAAATAALAALRKIAPRLEHPLIETEIMRRRRATIVLDAQAHLRVDPAMRDVMRWSSYVAAPLVVQGEVIGLVHADHGEGGRTVDALDRDVLWSFAVDFAQTYESTILRRALRRERDEARRVLAWVDARSGQLSDTAIELVVEEASPLRSAEDRAVPAAEAVDDRTVFDALLTRRELDVLRLVAHGLTNRAIAADLVMAEGTVKFHVNNILRRLGAANRAEAAARYVRTTAGAPAPAR